MMAPANNPKQTTTPQGLSGEKVIYSWKSPIRMISKKNRTFWVKLVAVTSLLGFIFFIAEGIMPVILLMSVLFLFYVMTSTETENIQYSITEKGIYIAGKRTDWEKFTGYKFVTRKDVNYLSLGSNVMSGIFELIVDSKDIHKIDEIISKYVKKNELPQSRFEKASEWISDKIS